MYCSRKCASFADKPRLIAGNISRRKYEKVEGLNRGQIFLLNNPEIREFTYQRDKRMRIVLLGELGGKCLRCGYDEDVRALQLDHINNDGHLDRKERGHKLYRYYINHLDEAKQRLQVLCANCNKIKCSAEQEYAKSKRTYK